MILLCEVKVPGPQQQQRRWERKRRRTWTSLPSSSATLFWKRSNMLDLEIIELPMHQQHKTKITHRCERDQEESRTLGWHGRCTTIEEDTMYMRSFCCLMCVSTRYWSRPLNLHSLFCTTRRTTVFQHLLQPPKPQSLPLLFIPTNCSCVAIPRPPCNCIPPFYSRPTGSCPAWCFRFQNQTTTATPKVPCKKTTRIYHCRTLHHNWKNINK